MTLNNFEIDPVTMYLLSNGDLPAWNSQKLYEYAWSQGIKPLRENELKPREWQMRRRKRGVA